MQVLSPSTGPKTMSTSTVVPPAPVPLAANVAPFVKAPKRSPHRQRAPRNKPRNQLQAWQQFNNAALETNNNQSGVADHNGEVATSVFPQPAVVQPGVFNPLAAFGYVVFERVINRRVAA